MCIFLHRLQRLPAAEPLQNQQGGRLDVPIGTLVAQVVESESLHSNYFECFRSSRMARASKFRGTEREVDDFEFPGSTQAKARSKSIWLVFRWTFVPCRTK